MSLRPIEITCGATKTLRRKLIDSNGLPVDLTGSAIKGAAREKPSDEAYKIAEIAADLGADPAAGEYSIEVTAPAAPFSGVWEEVMDVGGKRTVITPAGGLPIKVLSRIVA